MSKENKPNIKFIIGVVILFIVVGILGFVVGKNTTKKDVTNNESSDATNTAEESLPHKNKISMSTFKYGEDVFKFGAIEQCFSDNGWKYTTASPMTDRNTYKSYRYLSPKEDFVMGFGSDGENEISCDMEISSDEFMRIYNGATLATKFVVDDTLVFGETTIKDYLSIVNENNGYSDIRYYNHDYEEGIEPFIEGVEFRTDGSYIIRAYFETLSADESVVKNPSDTDLVLYNMMRLPLDSVMEAEPVSDKSSDQIDNTEKKEIETDDNIRDMAKYIIPYFLSSNHDEIAVADLSDNEKANLEYSALNYNYFLFDGTTYKDDTVLVLKSDTAKLLNDLFDLDIDELSYNQYISDYDDTYLALMPADGEWQWLDIPVTTYDMGDYLELSGPCMTGSDADWDYLGNITVKLRKNEQSQFGYTIEAASINRNISSIVDAVASSTLESQGSISYTAENLYDSDISTAWVEGVDGVGEGEMLKLYLDSKSKVYGLKIHNGYQSSQDTFEKNGTVSSILIDCGNGITNQYELGADLWAAEYIPLKEAEDTDCITITISSANSGEKYDDICISEISVVGTK